MMGIQPSEYGRFSLHEYEELLYHWNEAHETDSSPGPSDPERARRVIDSINANPLLTH